MLRSQRNKAMKVAGVLILIFVLALSVNAQNKSDREREDLIEFIR